MSEFKVHVRNLTNAMDEIQQAESVLRSVAGSVGAVKRSLRMQIRQSSRIESQLNYTMQQIEAQRQAVQRVVTTGRSIAKLYQDNEGKMIRDAEGKSVWDRFLEDFRSNFGIKELLKGSGYISELYDLAGELTDNPLKAAIDIGEFMKKAAETYSRYKKIGNAVGGKKATTWWLKNITGMKKVGRVSTAKNPVTAFTHNLTNKTSPYHKQIQEKLGNFSGKNGTGKAVASWAGVAISGITNLFGNIQEYKDSNGTMSGARVAAETVMETVVDTALTHGASIVVGAAVSAILPAAAPAVLVTALSGAVIAGINAGVKALTGKSTTEWISDTILDAGEAIGKAVGNAAKNVSNAIGNWFGKLRFA